MVTTLYRIFKYGLQNFLRNYLVSIATVLVMLLAVIVFQGLLVFGVIGDRALGTVRDKIDISVDFSDSVSEDDVLQIKGVLENMAEVKSVEYISKDVALERFKERHQDDENVTKALEEIESNPLQASLNIKAYDPKEYAGIADYFKDESFTDKVTNVSYSQNQTVIERLSKIMDIGRSMGFLLIVVMSIVAGIVSFNTILLAINSNKEEIGIMRLVGASNSFVRGPYIVVGAIYGIVSAVLAIIITTPFIFWSTSAIKVIIPEFSMWNYYITHIFGFLGLNLLFAVGIGIISSVIVVRRYLTT